MRVVESLALVLVVTTALSAQVLPYRVLDEPLPLKASHPDGAGDFDLDGNVDLLTAGGIFLGDGHGNFAAAPGAPLAFVRTTTRVADLNGDGFPDVVSLGNNSSLVRVDLNGGSLVFSQAPGAFPPFPAVLPGGFPPYISRFTTGDVDGDGDVDLVTQMSVAGAQYPYSVAPLLLTNNGLATFAIAPASAFPATTLQTSQEELGDFDGDGDLDALLTGYSGSLPVAVFLLTNNGTGIFAPPVQIVATLPWPCAAVGDFNGDGVADVALSLYLALPFSASMMIFFGSATGLGAGVTSTQPFTSRLIAIDLNADGRDELLAGYYGQAAAFTVSSTGVVSGPTQTLAGVQLDPENPGPDVVKDFDHDGDRDLVAMISNRPTLFMNDSAGSLVQVSGRIQGYSIAGAPLGGDVDGDGDLDFIGWSSAGATLATMLNDGDGFFTAGPTSSITGINPPQNVLLLHPFDKDGDGDVDLYGTRNMASVTSIPGPDVIFGNAGGVFTVALTLPDNSPVSVIRDVDMDGDGDRDIVLGRRLPGTSGNVSTAPMRLVRNDGAAGFAAAVPIGGNHATYDLEIADFDGNGAPDIFQTNRNFFPIPWGTDPCELHLNDGAGVFTSVVQTMTGYYSAAGDVDGNGLPDVVLDNRVWLNLGTGSFIAGPVFAPAIGTPPTLVDVDEDGDLDLVESPAVVRFNNGAGVFGAQISESPFSLSAPTAASVPTSIVADFDRDGGHDIFGTDGLLHMNCSRQIALGKRARPGRPGSLQMWGNPGSVFWLFASGSTANFIYPPFGNILINPAAAILVHGGMFAPIGSATPGFASIQGTLPADPALIGLTIYWQMVDVTASRLSNRLTTTIAGY